MKKVFFSNSGAEANECAIKVIRKYQEDKKSGKFNIITLKNSFHGRTLATLAATAQEEFHKNFLPLTPGFIAVEANNLEELEQAVKEHSPAGILFETIQGEGGVNPLSHEYVKGIEKIAHDNDMLIAVDEVQTGNGRTGELYSYMGYGITPDIVTTAKGIGGGLPLGVTMMGEKAENVLTKGTHGSTFGGNPIATAGAYSILSRINDGLLESVKQKSEYIFETLKGKKGIKTITGKGLMIGIETERKADDIVKDCLEKGVLVLKAKSKIRLLPALNIGRTELLRAIDIILECAAVEDENKK
jgi:acetylornithine/N-succinyldiaminopimelate aminotransferase